MNENTLIIDGIEFVDPVLEGLLLDLGISRVELLVAETAPPYNRHQSKRTRITFDEVIEFRAYRMPVSAEREKFWKSDEPYQAEEIHDAGEADAPGEVEHVNEAFLRLVIPPPFRDPQGATVGHRWLVGGTKAPRLVWLESWGCRIEFLYVGRVRHKDLTQADELEEWRLQRLRFER